MAVIFAIGVGIFSGIPQYLAREALGSDYQGVPYLFQDAEAVYLTRIQEFKDGHGDVTSPFLYEYKVGKSVMPPTGEYIYWLLSKITGTSIISVLVVSKYVFPAALFLLVYVFVLLLIKEGEGRRLLALAAATWITLGYELADVNTALSIFNGSYTSTYLSIWSRAVNPITGALLLFGFLISLLLLLREKYKATVPTILLLSVMTGYIFSFGIAFASLTIFIIVSLIFREYKKAVILFLILIGALLINLPHLLTFSTNEGEALKSGLLLTHTPLLSSILMGVILILVAGLFSDYVKKRPFSLDSPQVFLFIVLLAGFAAMNQQVITGKTVWPHHFVQYTIPLSMIAALVAFYVYIRPLIVSWWRLVLWGVIGISFMFALVSLPTYKNRLPEYKKVNDYAQMFEWLEKNDGPCVVLPVGEIEQINSYITALTHCDVYFTHYTFIGIPRERIIHNELVNMKFQNIPPEDVAEYLRDNEGRVRAVLFRDWRDLFHHSSDAWLISTGDRDEIDSWIEGQIQEMALAYKDFYRSDFRTELLKYRIDYVLHDKEGKIPFDTSRFPFLEKIYEDERFIAYEL